MKIAIVCDDLIQKGGAERVIFIVLKYFKNADLFASVITKDYQYKLNKLNINYHYSFMQKLPLINKLYRFYSVFFLHQIAFLNFDFSNYDLVISFTARYAHLLNTKPDTTHICYMHTPPRMFWNTNEYFKYDKYGKFKNFILPFIYLSRITDYIYSQKINYYIANSKNAKKRIFKIYGKKSHVINPSIDISKYYISNDKKDYFLVISRLVPWKNIDLIVNTFIKNTSLKLKIIGTGSDIERLKNLSKGYENIEFLGYITEYKKIEYISNAIATIQAHEEDFGLVPVESLACGTPVVAYNKGGVLEVIQNDKLGVLFNNQSVESLTNAIYTLLNTKYNSNYLKYHVQKFDNKLFIKKISEYINNTNKN